MKLWNKREFPKKRSKCYEKEVIISYRFCSNMYGSSVACGL